MRKLPQWTKRPWVKGVVGMVLAVGLIHIGSALTVDRSLDYTHITYTSPKVEKELSGYQIAFLTDIHNYPESDLIAMVERINREGVDLILLGGDFDGQKDLSRCFEILSGLDATDGIYGVEGNHDSADVLRDLMESRGMVLLENRGVTVRPGLHVAGVEDLWNRTPDVEAALARAEENSLCLLLAHNPDVTMEHDVSQVDLTLSGHVHGGQVTFFGVWSPATYMVTNYGHRFLSGWCKSGWDTDVYVSRGIGSWGFRVFSRPQVIFLTLEPVE